MTTIESALKRLQRKGVPVAPVDESRIVRTLDESLQLLQAATADAGDDEAAVGYDAPVDLQLELPSPADLSADSDISEASDQPNYEQGVTEIVVGDAVADYGTMVDLSPLDRLLCAVECVDAGTTSGVSLAEPDTLLDATAEPPLDCDAVAVEPLVEVDEAITDAVLIKDEPGRSTFVESPPSATTDDILPIHAETPSTEKRAILDTSTQELLPEDLMQVLAEIEEQQQSILDGTAQSVSATDAWSGVPAPTAPMLSFSETATEVFDDPNRTQLHAQFSPRVSDPAQTASLSPEENIGYADLLSEAPFDELAQWDELLGSISPDEGSAGYSESLNDHENDPPSQVVPSLLLSTDTFSSATASSSPVPAPSIARAVIPFDSPIATPTVPLLDTTRPAPTAFEFESLQLFENESYRTQYEEFAANIMRMSGNGTAVTAVFVSAEPEEHVAQTIARVAIILARQKAEPILIVDGNLKHQSLTKGYQAHGADGFADLIAPLPLDSVFHATTVRPTFEPFVFFLPAGGRIDRNQVDAASVTTCLNRLTQKHVVLLVDGGVVGDTLTQKVAAGATEVFLVVRLGKTDQEAAVRARDTLQQAGITVTGCIATNVTIK